MKRSVLISLLWLLVGVAGALAQSSSPGTTLPAQPVPYQPEVIPSPTPAPTPVPGACPTPLAAAAPVADIPPNPPLQTPPASTSAVASFANVAQFTVPQRFWFNSEYLLWFIKDSNLPPLLTAGSTADTFPAALGQPNTETLIGGSVYNGVRSGMRFSGGYWFTDTHTIGIDSSFIYVGGDAIELGAASDGNPVLGRPFYNILMQQEMASPVAYPGFQSGSLLTRLTSELWSADVNLRAALLYQPTYQLSFLGGFRYFNLTESLHTFEDDTFATGSLASAAQVSDWIRVSNNFYGGQLGAEFNTVFGRWSLDLLGKAALGVMNETTHLSGASRFTYPDGSMTALGVGALVQPSNSGSYGQSRFAVLPEGTATVGFAVTQHIRLTIGYTFLYVSNVFRPGDQIDHVVNPSQVTAMLANQQPFGPARPGFNFATTDFWAQGVNFGMQIRY
jgi:hypothetical protein